MLCRYTKVEMKVHCANVKVVGANRGWMGGCSLCSGTQCFLDQLCVTDALEGGERSTDDLLCYSY